MVNRVLADMGQQQDETSGYKRQGGSHEKGVATSCDFVFAGVFLKRIKGVRACKRTDLANRRGDAVVLAPSNLSVTRLEKTR